MCDNTIRNLVEDKDICIKIAPKCHHFVSNPKCTVAWPSSYNYVAITSIKIEGMTFIVYDKHGYN